MESHTLAYLGYALAQAALAVWAFRLWRAERSAGAFALLVPISTVVYDNLMIALGSFIGPGPLLEALTVPRFAGHALFTPLWIVAAVHLALKAGAFERHRARVAAGAWGLYGVMAAIGLLNEVVFFRGEWVSEGDVSYYTNVGRILTPPPPSLTMLLVVLVCGVIVLARVRWPWMLLGGLTVLGSQAVRSDTVAFALINSTEVILSTSLVATLSHLKRRVRLDAPAPVET